MSRSGYVDDDPDDQEAWCRMIGWQAALKRAMRSNRGQAFLLELRDALDAMRERELVANAFEQDGAVCALGSVAKRRGVEMPVYEPDEDSYYDEGVAEEAAGALKIAKTLAAEIMDRNDDGPDGETPAHRWQRMRHWVEKRLRVWQWPTAEWNPNTKGEA